MKLGEFKNNLFNYAKKANFSDCEVYILSDQTLRIKVFGQQIDNFSSSQVIGISFRGIYKGKTGKSYSENIDNHIVDKIIDQAKANACIMDSKNKEFFHDNSGSYKELNEYSGEIENIDINDKINYALSIERKIKDKKHVFNINYCCYEEHIYQISIYNTKGLERTFKNDLYIIMGDAIVSDIKNNNKLIKGESFSISKNIKGIENSINYVTENAYQKAISQVGAKNIVTGHYKILIENEAMSEILSFYLPNILSAENVQNNNSFLKGMLNNKIGVDNLTIIEDPHLKNAWETRPFDDEGFPTNKKDLIKNGILKTFLHNLKTANKSNIKSTGNARIDSFFHSTGISPTNVIVEKGDSSIDQLVKMCSNALYVTKIKSFDGLNFVSGDFSFHIEGLKIENGEVCFPVNNVSISGNFFDLLNNIENIGNDTKGSMPRIIKYRINTGTYYSPSILFSEMKVTAL